MVEMMFVAAVAGATLAFELVQTRVLSTLYYNHVVYVTVTIALMGFGISGVATALLARRLSARAHALAAWCGAGFAISMLVCLYVASHIPAALPTLPPVAKLLLSYLVLVVPFLFSGAALGLVFMAGGARIHRLYAADLVASAAAALAVCLLLAPLGAHGLAWGCVLVAVGAFLLLGVREGLPHGAMALVALVAASPLLLAPEALIGNQAEPYKTAGRFHAADWTSEELLASRWTMSARIDVWSDDARDLETGRPLAGASTYRMITQDNDAHTNILGPEERERIAERVERGEPIEPLDLLYTMGRSPERVLVVGPGGGKDVVIANAYGAKRIDAAELNAATVGFVSGQFRDYAAWPAWDHVELQVAEGRHFVRTAGRTYDALVMSGVDTFAALSSGAYVLSENYLYTVEAIQDYLAALEPDGILGIYRWFFPQPRENLRLVNLYLEAAAEQGIAGPERSVMVIAGAHWAATLIKKGAFTVEEVRTAMNRMQAKDEFAFVLLPEVLPPMEQATLEAEAFERRHDELRPAREAFKELIEADAANERAAFADGYVYNITPVRDDRPFFFEYFKPATGQEDRTEWAKGGLREQFTALRGNASHYLLHILFALTAVIGFLAMIVPLLMFDRQGLHIDRGVSLAGFFASLGFGFMLVEIGLMQKLTLYLGHPMYSVAVVLAGVLLFAGLGALLAGRLPLTDLAKIALGMVGTAALALLWLLLAGTLLDATAGWPLVGRVAICLLTLAPLATVMGIPFATGLRYLERRHPRFIPWAWGVNGITSVLGSVAAIMIAMRAGFTVVLVAGAAVYALGLSAFLLHRRRPAAMRTARQPVSG